MDRRTIILGMLLIVGMVVLFMGFGNGSMSATSALRQADESATSEKYSEAVITKIQQLIDRTQQKDEDIETKLDKIESHILRILKDEDNLKALLTKPKEEPGRKPNEMLEALAKRIDINLDGWTTKQDNFLAAIEGGVKEISDRLEGLASASVTIAPSHEPSTTKSSGPQDKPDPASKPAQPTLPPKKSNTAQDEIEQLYEEEDRKKSSGHEAPKEQTGQAEEISDKDLDTEEPDNYVIVSENVDVPEPEDTDANNGCGDDIEDLISTKNLPALSNHEGNSRCLYLNGRPSLYCDKKRSREEGWFRTPNASEIHSIPLPAASSLTPGEFPDRSTIKIVGLASMVRSGNSWIRNLIEVASGIVTEAAYLREGPTVTPWATARKTKGHSGKAARGVHENEHVLVKTHHADGRYPYAKVIRLMRFPLDIEPWMRFTRNVKESHKLEHFKTRFVQEYLEWHGKWNCWPGPQLIVRYEDLVDDTDCVLKEVLDFLEYEYTDESVAKAIKEFPPTELTEKGGVQRPVGWDVPSEYLDYATQIFAVVVREFGYIPQMDEVQAWREENGV